MMVCNQEVAFCAGVTGELFKAGLVLGFLNHEAKINR
jgi:hypothetical protein